MNRLLPAPKSIEKLGNAFVPHRWRFIQFPRGVEKAAEEIWRIMEKWNGRFIEKTGFEDGVMGEGYWFWLGEEEPSQNSINPNGFDRRKISGKTDAYQLNIKEKGVWAWSASLSGLYYALQTLSQILNGEEIFELMIVDWPDLLWRGVHVDAKGERPKFGNILETVREWSHYKVNIALFEYEDTFPYSYPFPMVGCHAYSPWQIQGLQNLARDHFITIVPLIQTIGHAEYILKEPRYVSLREGGEISQFCSSREEVFQLLGDLIHQVAEAHADSPWIHIGGDEAWYLGQCSDCADKAAKVGKGRLYIEHMNRVIQMVKETGKTPIMWDDVLRRLDNREEIEGLDRSCIIHYWDYQTCGNPLDSDWIQFLHSYGFQVIGGSAMRGASGMDSSCPKFQQRYRNAKDWGYTADRFSLPGVIATSWGRYGTLKPLIEPFDLGWYGALAATEHFWNAQGMEKHEFDQRFAHVFLGDTKGEFPKWWKRFEKEMPYQPEWLEGKEPLVPIRSRNFLTLLDVVWKWRSEEQSISRKLELLEARLYRVAEESFPVWERWRMVDRAQELEDNLHRISNQLRESLSGVVESPWQEEYIQAFTGKYFFRMKNVLHSLIPLTPRQPESLAKIGADYG